MFSVREHRAQQQTVEAIEELLQLRRWDQAGMALQIFLSTPARSPRVRAQALVYLASLLARHHRFEDAIAVQDYLLDHELVAEAQAAYERATLLSPVSELHRRYPEVAKLAEKYTPAPAPVEAI